MGPQITDRDAVLEALIAEARKKLGARKGANRIYRVPPLAAALPVAGASPSDSNPISIRFTRRSIVLAVYGSVSDALDSTAATTEARIQIGGEYDVVTDGTSGQFGVFLALFGKTQNWYPLELKGDPAVPWVTTLRNTSTGVTVTPSIHYAVFEYGGK